MGRNWRHHLDRKKALRRRRYRRMLFMTAVILAGSGAAVSGAVHRMDMRWIRREQNVELEWGPRCGTAVFGDGGFGEIYGIRICPDTLEIQFYRRQQSIRDH